MSSGSQKVDNSYSRTPTFDFPGSRGLADSLLSQTNERQFSPDNAWREQGMNFLSDTLRGEPMQFNMSDPLKQQISGIREQADFMLPQELNQARSNYYRGPSGRAIMGIDDAVLRNRIGRDGQINSLMSGQYNQDRQFAGNAANNMITSDAASQQQAMQLLQMLSGEKGKGAQQSSGSVGAGGLLGGLGSFASGIGALTGGPPGAAAGGGIGSFLGGLFS